MLPWLEALAILVTLSCSDRKTCLEHPLVATTRIITFDTTKGSFPCPTPHQQPFPGNRHINRAICDFQDISTAWPQVSRSAVEAPNTWWHPLPTGLAFHVFLPQV